MPSSRFPTPPTVLVMHQGALGDFLLALPVFEGLYRLEPSIRIHFCSKPQHITLIANKPYVGNAYNPDNSELSLLFHEELWRSARIPEYFSGVDSIFVFGQSGSKLLSERLAQRLDASVIWVRSFPGTGILQHVSSYLADQVRLAGWPIDEISPVIESSEDGVDTAREWLVQAGLSENERPVIVHLGSGGVRKVWPLSRWWTLLRRLRLDYGIPVLMVVGPADEYLRPFAKEASTEIGIKAAEGLNLQDLSALLSLSRLYIGNDSGVSHLAGLLGIPVIVFFGPTSPRVWAPQGPNVHIVESRWEESEVLKWSSTGAESGVDPDLFEMIGGLLGCRAD